jgi:hypothetical protein
MGAVGAGSPVIAFLNQCLKVLLGFREIILQDLDICQLQLGLGDKSFRSCMAVVLEFFNDSIKPFACFRIATAVAGIAADMQGGFRSPRAVRVFLDVLFKHEYRILVLVLIPCLNGRAEGEIYGLIA